MGLDNLLERRTRAHQRRERRGGGGDGGEPIGRFVRADCHEGTAKAIQTGLEPGAAPRGALAGAPAYLNGYAAPPLVAGLIEQGMAPGAGMAFLIAGGVSCIPAAMAVFALTRLPVFFAYLMFALSGSILAGLAYGVMV